MEQIKNYKAKIVTIRAAYWIGIVLDFLSAIATTIYMLAPNETFINTIMKFPPITDIAFVLLITETALMWGWTALLFWADRKPIERRGVFILTIAPVITLIIVNTTIGLIRGNPYMSAIRFIVIVALVMMIIGYIFATMIAKKKNQISESVIS